MKKNILLFGLLIPFILGGCSTSNEAGSSSNNGNDNNTNVDDGNVNPDGTVSVSSISLDQAVLDLNTTDSSASLSATVYPVMRLIRILIGKVVILQLQLLLMVELLLSMRARQLLLRRVKTVIKLPLVVFQYIGKNPFLIMLFILSTITRTPGVMKSWSQTHIHSLNI